ncbi:MAG: chorismate mutase [Promicromonosporaceae bacterium]|nr:chorismate mutase [Promicromonosporaceae bacterium]
MSGQPIPAEILKLRRSIDNIDAALVHMLAERFRMTQRVGEIKAEDGLPPADPARDQQQIARLVAIATEAGLDPAFAEAFRAFVVAEVIRHHELIAADYAVGVRAEKPPPLDTFA